jgi:hypothetical protein
MRDFQEKGMKDPKVIPTNQTRDRSFLQGDDIRFAGGTAVGGAFRVKGVIGASKGITSRQMNAD